MGKRITIDPITRIEGHLRIDVEIDNNRVSNAWASAQMWRGIETILKGRDPRDAWVFAQRFCGVCTTVHAIASIRSVEDAYKVEVPVNAQMVRNAIIAQHSVHDHIVHFYHLSALDWVDIVSALKADPKKAAQIAQSISNWPGNAVGEFKAVQERLQKFVDTGKLGVFGSGYWGHPDMRLSPEINLIAVSHYLQALELQRKAAQAVAILGSKNPHIQNLCVGGVATAINMDSPAALNMEKIAQVKTLMEETKRFVNEVYVPDVIAIASAYKDWFKIGKGVVNYLAVPEFPLDTVGGSFGVPGGFIDGGDLSTFKVLNTHNDPFLRRNITEDVAHAWYEDFKARHPWEGETTPNYTDFEDDGKYSWCKAPRLDGKPIQVGPLAQTLAAYLAGEPNFKRTADSVMGAVGIGVGDLHSTMGRHAARAIRASVMADKSIEYMDRLVENYASGDTEYANTSELPKGKFQGVGFHEAPRGTLSHWAVVEDGKLENYQAVVPSTWNASPRDEAGNLGPYEASLLQTPIADPTKPLEVVRTVHSFDPCIACAVHAHEPDGEELARVKVL